MRFSFYDATNELQSGSLARRSGQPTTVYWPPLDNASNPMPDFDKPFAPACERNKAPILAQLSQRFAAPGHVLEIGSGTGQHACHFAAHLSHITWQTSDVADNLPGIRAWIEESRLTNLPSPLELDVLTQPWPLTRTDAAFSANTAHILSWPGVQALFAGVRSLLGPGALWVLYGPFNYAGKFTSPGNETLDQWARATFPGAGLRDFETIARLGQEQRFSLVEDVAMPANNRLLVFRRDP